MLTFKLLFGRIGFFLFLLLSASDLLAHESRPAYLELKETAPGRYDVLWRTPVLSGMSLPVVLRFTPSVTDLVEPVVQQLPDSLIERRVIQFGPAGLDGQSIEFAGLQATITDVLVRGQRLDGTSTTKLVLPSQPWFALTARQSAWEVAFEYAKLGITHILLGIDHLLFVLALLIITRFVGEQSAAGALAGGRGNHRTLGFRPETIRLIKTITAFTVAHSITLGLATLGFIHVPQPPIEAIIALSIVFVAAEIIHTRRGVTGITARAPWIVAFAFGLLHGLGFASALSEIGLPPGHIPTALLFFNLGVEAGQLLFVTAALGLIAITRHLPLSLPRWMENLPPYAIGGIAMFWVVQRVAVF